MEGSTYIRVKLIDHVNSSKSISRVDGIADGNTLLDGMVLRHRHVGFLGENLCSILVATRHQPIHDKIIHFSRRSQSAVELEKIAKAQVHSGWGIRKTKILSSLQGCFREIPIVKCSSLYPRPLDPARKKVLTLW
jgi:hypothetical protein